MAREISRVSLVAILLVGCGSVDSAGLYSTDQAGSGGVPSLRSADGGELLPPAGGDDAKGDDAAQGDEDAATDGDGPSPSCAHDESCAPLVCNTKLGVCKAPGSHGAPCNRDVECKSHECKKHACR